MKKLVLLTAIFGLVALWIEVRNGTFESHTPQPVRFSTDGRQPLSPKVISRTNWGNPASLPDHFARHGHDFGARNADEYALMANQFLRRATVAGYRAKLDNADVLRVFDPATGTFGAYNPDGTTKTFFKVRDPSYFNRQPGRMVDLRTGQ